MRLSVVCPSRIGCRSVWLKGTPYASGLLPSPQPVYATNKKRIKMAILSNQQI